MAAFESSHRHGFVPKVTITAVPKDICALWYSRAVGEVVQFTKRFSELLRIQQTETTIAHENSRYNEYHSKQPAEIADQIIASTWMQTKLPLATPFTVDNTTEIVGE
jgi:hypothetical protein